jgi:hypothetical protein
MSSSDYKTPCNTVTLLLRALQMAQSLFYSIVSPLLVKQWMVLPKGVQHCMHTKAASLVCLTALLEISAL